jgi:hypothetical protein
VKFRRKKLQPYCSKKCYSLSIIKYKTCPMCGKHYPSDPNTKYCSVECYKKSIKSRPKVKLSDEHKKKISEARRNSQKCKGENLYNWKGGKETEAIRMRMHSRTRAAKLGKKADPNFIKALMIAQKGKCFYCDKDISDYYEIEHLTPIKNGGKNQEYNLVLSCRKCNSKKRTKSMETYAIIEGKNWPEKWEHIYTTALIIKDKINDRRSNISKNQRNKNAAKQPEENKR